MTNLPAHVKIKLKRVFEAVPKGADEFYFKDTKENCLDIEWFLERYPMSISEPDESRLKSINKEYRDMLADLEKIYKPNYRPEPIKLKEGKAPYPYQQVCAELLWKVKRLLCGDGVGMGKTITAITALTNPDTLPAVVVVQPHLQDQWDEQIKAFSNLKTHIVRKGKPTNLPPADVYILKYTNIYKWSDVLKECQVKTLVMDEVQEIRRHESQKHQGCKQVAVDCEYVFGLSGTPVYNYGFETWTLYNVIKPGLLDDESSFRREWCGWGDRVNDPVALGTFLRDSFAYIRRTKAEVKQELQPINKIVHTVDFDQKAIDKMQSEAKTLALSVLQGEFVERGQAARELSILVRKATGISKAKSVAEYVKMILDSGQKVLLAGWHRDVYDIWLRELAEYNPVMYTGTESPAQKEKNKKKFIDGESQLMIISLRSGVGLDGLQHVCSYVVFGELDWTPSVHEQVIGRLDREGQEEQVTAIFLTTDSGSDPIVIDINGLKRAQQEGINNPNAIGTKQDSDDSIIKEFAKKYLEKVK